LKEINQMVIDEENKEEDSEQEYKKNKV